MKPKDTIVEVTIFVPPNGMKKIAQLSLPASVQSGYDKVVRNGCRLTSETLGTGQVSVTIEEPRLGDFVIRLTNSYEEAEKALVGMIEAFSEEEFEQWKSRREQMM
jgi:alpha-galactosidase/6-phospho-beta-glucosidase family protein